MRYRSGRNNNNVSSTCRTCETLSPSLSVAELPVQTYLTIGQDYPSINDYRSRYDDGNDDNDDIDHNVNDDTAESSSSSLPVSSPSIYMFYTDIQQLQGLYEPIDYGGGIQYADGLVQLLLLTKKKHEQNGRGYGRKKNSGALQIGLWLNGTKGCSDIIQGVLDRQIERLLHYCFDTTTSSLSNIYLRIGYEFDNPSFGYSTNPKLFQQAFRYIVSRCYEMENDDTRNKCHSKVQFVWHSWAASLLPPTISANDTTTTSITSPSTTLDDYYPGNEFVDWVGISIFSQLYTANILHETGIQSLGNIATVKYVCEFAQQLHINKPIMIAESTPFGGIDVLHDPWNDWFVPVLQFIQSYRIQMWSYIYCHWDSIPMWDHVGFGNSRLEINHTVNDLWIQNVLQNSQFQIHPAASHAATNSDNYHHHQQDITKVKDNCCFDQQLFNPSSFMTVSVVPQPQLQRQISYLPWFLFAALTLLILVIKTLQRYYSIELNRLTCCRIDNTSDHDFSTTKKIEEREILLQRDKKVNHYGDYGSTDSKLMVISP